MQALHSRAERQRVIDYFHDNLMNLLEPDGRFWGLFTPWHTDDLNARLKKNGAYALFREAVGADFEPVWEEKWPAERLRERKAEIGSLSFARGYLLQPVAGEETTIRPEWVRYWSAGVSPASDVLAGQRPALAVRTGHPVRRSRRLDRNLGGSQRAGGVGTSPLGAEPDRPGGGQSTG